jgi:hypothetical protein
MVHFFRSRVATSSRLNEWRSDRSAAARCLRLVQRLLAAQGDSENTHSQAREGMPDIVEKSSRGVVARPPTLATVGAAIVGHR